MSISSSLGGLASEILRLLEETLFRVMAQTSRHKACRGIYLRICRGSNRGGSLGYHHVIHLPRDRTITKVKHLLRMLQEEYFRLGPRI